MTTDAADAHENWSDRMCHRCREDQRNGGQSPVNCDESPWQPVVRVKRMSCRPLSAILVSIIAIFDRCEAKSTSNYIQHCEKWGETSGLVGDEEHGLYWQLELAGATYPSTGMEVLDQGLLLFSAFDRDDVQKALFPSRLDQA